MHWRQTLHWTTMLARGTSIIDLVFFFWSICSVVHCLGVYSIGNASLVALSHTPVTTLLNATCDQCLCSALQSNAIAFNCFLGNKTCNFFDNFPRTYRLKSIQVARLYFPRGALPNASESCMSDTSKLLGQLSNATVTSLNITGPRCLVIDNHGYLVTVEDRGYQIHRLDPLTLTRIDSTNFAGSPMMNIAYFRGAYYIARDGGDILIVNSNNLTVINIVTSWHINVPRDIIFVQDGQTLVLASAGNNRLLFFNCTDNVTRNYAYAYAVLLANSAPHGLWYVNDVFFYATSWAENKIYSYSYNGSTSWTEQVFANAWPISSSSGGSHVTVDQSGRSWYSLYQYGVAIFDEQGVFLSSFQLIPYGLFDVMFDENYVMYLSDVVGGKIVRLDPHITCWS